MYKIGTFFYSLEKAVPEGKAKDIDEAMYKAAKAGITHIDMHSEMEEFYDIKYLNEIMKKNGMSIASIHCAKPAQYKDELSYRKSADDFKRAAEFACMLKSPYFMIVPQKPLGYKERDFIKFRSCARELIGELSEYVSGLGITPTIEDYSFKTTAYGRLEDIKLLLDTNPKLMFTYDSGNFVLAGNDELTGAQLFSDRTVYVHMKDLSYDEERVEFVRDGVAYDSVAIGSGFLRIKKALDILKNGRFTEGVVTIESGYTYDSFEKMINSAQYLKEVL